MSDDLRDGDEQTELRSSTLSGNEIGSVSPSGDGSTADKISVLQAIEHALSKSSAKLGELLSLITSAPAPWLSELSRFESSAGDTDAVGTSGNVTAWVAPDPDAPVGLGRIMMSWSVYNSAETAADGSSTELKTKLAGVLSNESPIVTSSLAASSGRAANDNVIWVGDEDGAGAGGVYGREVSVATLDDGKTVIAWIGEDNIVHAKLYHSELSHFADRAEEVSDGGINALLANLGEAAPGNGKDTGKLKISAVGPVGFAAVWVAELGLTAALIGKVFTPSAEANGEQAGHGAQNEWTVHELPSVPVHESNIGALSVTANSDGLTIGYASANEADAEAAPIHEIKLSLSEIKATHLASGPVDHPSEWTHAHHSTILDVSAENRAEFNPDRGLDSKDGDDDDGGLALPEHHSGDLASNSPSTDDNTLRAVTPEVIVAGSNSDTTNQIMPKVVSGPDKTIHVLDVEPGSEVGTSTLKVTSFKAPEHVDGTPAPPSVFEVTTQAITFDSAAPQLDLAPDITIVGNDIAVAWIQNDVATGLKVLAVQVFDEGGNCDAAPVIIATSDAPGSTISDIDMAGCGDGQSVSHDDSGNSDSGTSVAELAVVWVKDGNADGYGAVNMQVFAVAEEGSTGLQPVGLDFNPNGDNAPGQLMVDAQPVIGRDPQIESIKGGAVAVAWVASETAGAETVKGVVLDGHDGQQLVAIDLSSFMQEGVAKGTSPSLATDANGDIVVSWVQAATAGGFNAEAAVYSFVSAGQWLKPAAAFLLSHFDDLPKDFSVLVSGDDTPSLLMTWKDHGDVNAARFDLNGTQIGATVEVHSDSGGGSSGGSNDQSVSSAVVSDSQFVVVYTKADGSDTDIGAKIFAIDGSTTAHQDNSGPADAQHPLVQQALSVLDNSGSLASNVDTATTLDHSTVCDTAPKYDVQPDPSAAATVGDAPSIPASGETTTASESSCAPVQASVATVTVEADFARDLIRLLDSNSTDGGGHGTSGDFPTGDCISAQDLAAAIETYTGSSGSGGGSGPIIENTSVQDNSAADGSTDDHLISLIADDSHNGSHSGSDSGSNSGSGSSSGSSGSGGDHVASNDNFVFLQGYGNDVADPPTAIDAAPIIETFDAVAAAFDALQFANALNVDTNQDVLVFDTTNVVTIRNFNTIGVTDTILG